MGETPTRVLVFDAYGTLFDVAAVRHACAAVSVDPARFLALWRAKQLEYAFLRALMHRYADFWTVTRDALRYAAAATVMPLEPDQEQALMEAWFHVLGQVVSSPVDEDCKREGCVETRRKCQPSLRGIGRLVISHS